MPRLSLMLKPVSSSCNMRCKYCFYTDVCSRRAQGNLGRMSLETLETVVRRALRYADGPVSFAFQGGEPSLAGYEFFNALIEFEHQYNAKGLQIYNSVQTNGFSIDDKLLSLFAREKFLVGVSLDGTKAIHNANRVDAFGNGTYDAVLDTIGALQKRDIAFNVLCVITESAAKEPESVFKALSSYGFIQYIPCLDDFDGTHRDYSLSAESYGSFLIRSFELYHEAYKKGMPVSIRNFDNYINMLRGFPPESCAMSGRCAQYYLIEADGSVYPCDYYVTDKWLMGNIKNNAFYALAKSPAAHSFWKDSCGLCPECNTCKWYGLCRGGCRRDREPFDGALPHLNKWCSSYKALFDNCYESMLDMAKTVGRYY